MTLDPPPDLNTLCELAGRYYEKGWLPATAGNLSLRSSSGDQIWITASGLEKGFLKPENFLPISLSSGEPLESLKGKKPSAETSIHLAIYRNHPSVNAVLHAHPPETMRIQLKLNSDHPLRNWKLPCMELLKVFGFFDQDPAVFLPVLFNFATVSKIAELADKHFQNINPKIKYAPAILVENHGPTVWGNTLREAHQNLEALEYLIRVSPYYEG
jgi:methylthioribulose-1-phosphate dehydratase